MEGRINSEPYPLKPFPQPLELCWIECVLLFAYLASVMFLSLSSAHKEEMKSEKLWCTHSSPVDSHVQMHLSGMQILQCLEHTNIFVSVRSLAQRLHPTCTIYIRSYGKKAMKR